MVATFAQDYSFGIDSEIANHKLIEKILKTPLTRKGGKAIYDFVNEKATVHADLKTRRIRHNDYPTALIGANKVEYADQNTNSDYWFIYKYLDGVYSIKYEKKLFDTFEKRLFERSSRSDNNAGPQLCYFIPHSALTNCTPQKS